MLAIPLIALILLGQSTPAVDKAELLRLASTGWDRLETIYSRVHGSYVRSSSSTLKDVPQPGQLSEYFFDFSGLNGRYYSVNRGRENWTSEISCFNAEYRFSIGRDPKTSLYVLRRYARGIPDPSDPSSKAARRPLCIPFAMNPDMTWKALIRRPTFRLTSFKREVTNGVPTAVITFDNQPDPDDWPLILSGRCVFDTANSWQLLESSCVSAGDDFKNMVTSDYRVSYQPDADPKVGIRWVKQIDAVTNSPGFKAAGAFTYQFKALDICDHDASHFRLPAFGLPEPPAESRPKSVILP